jgi:hypothetical protein
MADLTPRSTLVAGVRRIAETYTSATSHTSTGGSSRGSSRGARRLLRAHEARGA